jgi:hypothetical protein
MTIKQLGGVFGRNPTFNDVTIEGELTFDGDIDINSDLKISQDFEVVGDSGFGAAPNSNYRINALDTNAVVMAVSRDGTDGDAIQIFNGAVFGTRCLGLGVSGSNGTINNQYGNIEITTSSALIGKFTVNGFAPEDGKGIDFSATAGTGTSELLDDYEEGDWTPAFANIGTGTYTHQVGRYTKVGNLVTASVHIDINVLGTASGSVDITNLPFTASAVSNNYGSASSIHAQNFTTAAEGLNVLINPNTAVANVLSGAGATSGAVSVTHAVMGTGNLLCTLVYFTA